MSEPRYPSRVSDPDETTRIPKEALDSLREADERGSPDGSVPAKDSGTNGSGPNGSVAHGSGPDGSARHGSTQHGSGRNGSAHTGAPSSPGVPTVGGSPSQRSGATPRSNGFRSGEASSPPTGGSGSSPAGPGNGSAPRPSVFGSGSGGSRPAQSGGLSGALPGTAPGGIAASTGVGSGSASGGYTGRSETGYSPSAYSPSYSPSAYPPIGDQPTTVTRGLGGAAAGSGLGAGVGTAARPNPGPRPKGAGAPGRPARRARLLIRHIDPWSTLKFSFVLAVAMFFVWLVAVGVLYGVLDGMGVFEQINGLYSEVAGTSGDQLFTPSLVLGTAALVGAVNIVLFTALATIGAFVYNICSDLVGGIEVTLAERD